MRLMMYEPGDNITNFGDRLNIIFPMLRPDLFNGTGKAFVGIGTMVHDKNVTEPTVVFGGGCGYHPPPDLSLMDIVFVRGPNSAEVLGGVKWITDPGIIVPKTLGVNTAPIDGKVGFMPRWTTLLWDPTLKERVESIGITLIDPMEKDLMVTLSLIGECSVVICGAFHAAVVADAMGIPWIPIVADPNHSFKWYDWCASKEIPYNPYDMRVSSLGWVKNHGKTTLTAWYRHKQQSSEILGLLKELSDVS